MAQNRIKPEWAPNEDNEAFTSFVLPKISDDESSLNKSKGNVKSIEYTLNQYIDGIKQNNRVILSKSITLVESNSPTHFDKAQEIVNAILPFTGNSIRIGITGSPGVGKSTFIESFGTMLTELGHRVAVLAIDPSSIRSRGSILGDKTRMEKLSRNPNAFIRPSSSSGTLGGVARKTRETMLLCEAAGYDIILIETVGVGQSEVTVKSMVDVFLVMLLPNSGDELQGIKKGIIELADILVVNKAEEENIPKALLTEALYKNAVHLLQHSIPNFIPPVLSVSALNSLGLDLVWQKITDFIKFTKEIQYFEHNRHKQLTEWFNALLNELIMRNILNIPKNQLILKNSENEILSNMISPVSAANKVFNEIFTS